MRACSSDKRHRKILRENEIGSFVGSTLQRGSNDNRGLGERLYEHVAPLSNDQHLPWRKHVVAQVTLWSVSRVNYYTKHSRWGPGSHVLVISVS